MKKLLTLLLCGTCSMNSNAQAANPADDEALFKEKIETLVSEGWVEVEKPAYELLHHWYLNAQLWQDTYRLTHNFEKGQDRTKVAAVYAKSAPGIINFEALSRNTADGVFTSLGDYTGGAMPQEGPSEYSFEAAERSMRFKPYWSCFPSGYTQETTTEFDWEVLNEYRDFKVLAQAEFSCDLK